jgi:hypothetical protein
MPKPKVILESATIDGVEYPIAIASDLEINPTDLETEYCNQAQRYRTYGELAEAAKDEAERCKVELGRLYAVTDERVRTDNVISNEAAKKAGAAPVRMTEKMVENCVITDPAYVAKQMEYFAAKRQAGILKVYQDSMQHRLQMLIGIGANYRAEGQADPVLLRTAVKDRYRKQQQKEREEEQPKKPVKTPVGKKATR